jgi:hypothetical protein
VCACTHYLVFKEPTDQSSLERLEAASFGAHPIPETRLSARIADRVQGNLLRLLEPFDTVKPPKCRRQAKKADLGMHARFGLQLAKTLGRVFCGPNVQ